MTVSSIRQSRFSRSISFCLIVTFVFSMIITPKAAFAQGGVAGLPQPGTMVDLSPAYVPLMVTGLTIHPENPLLMDFIVSTGNSGLNADQVKKESERLIKYFLACLTIPENDQWVNLSPYEKQRIVPEDLGQTVLGQDMLAQDYLLKQLTASLIYPEKNLGKNFWDKVYAKASQMYGTTQIPMNTFNKVWILPEYAKVYEHNNTVFVVKSHLKVMLDEDYLALNKHASSKGPIPSTSYSIASLRGTSETSDAAISERTANNLGSQVVRQIILPAIEEEVNTGHNFAQMRQIYNSMILAVWFKNNLKEALLNQVYTNKSKVNGVKADDPAIKEKIYKQYLQAYKKGVFNYIKEEVDQNSREVIPRRYFSGGLTAVSAAVIVEAKPDEAMHALEQEQGETYRLRGLTQNAKSIDGAMLANLSTKLTGLVQLLRAEKEIPPQELHVNEFDVFITSLSSESDEQHTFKTMMGLSKLTDDLIGFYRRQSTKDVEDALPDSQYRKILGILEEIQMDISKLHVMEPAVSNVERPAGPIARVEVMVPSATKNPSILKSIESILIGRYGLDESRAEKISKWLKNGGGNEAIRELKLFSFSKRKGGRAPYQALDPKALLTALWIQAYYAEKFTGSDPRLLSPDTMERLYSFLDSIKRTKIEKQALLNAFQNDSFLPQVVLVPNSLETLPDNFKQVTAENPAIASVTGTAGEFVVIGEGVGTASLSWQKQNDSSGLWAVRVFPEGFEANAVPGEEHSTLRQRLVEAVVAKSEDVYRQVINAAMLSPFHEQRAREVLAYANKTNGATPMPTHDIERMFRIDDVPLNIMNINMDQKRKLWKYSWDFLRQLSSRNGHITWGVMAGGSASRMAKGKLPQILIKALKEDPEQFVDVTKFTPEELTLIKDSFDGDYRKYIRSLDPGVEAEHEVLNRVLHESKALLPADGPINGKWYNLLGYNAINVKRANDDLEAMGLNRVFIFKVLANDGNYKKLLQNLVQHNFYGLKVSVIRDAGGNVVDIDHTDVTNELVMYNQGMGYRLVAPVKTVEAQWAKDRILLEQAAHEENAEKRATLLGSAQLKSPAAYEYALAFSQANEGKVLYNTSIPEGHGERFHALFETTSVGPKIPMIIQDILRHVEYDYFHNIDNMASLNDDWMLIFGYMIKNHLLMTLEGSLRPSTERGGGGGFDYTYINDGYGGKEFVYRQTEDSVTKASLGKGPNGELISPNYDQKAEDERAAKIVDGIPNQVPVNNASELNKVATLESIREGEDIISVNFSPEMRNELADTLQQAIESRNYQIDLRKFSTAERQRYGVVSTIKSVADPNLTKPGADQQILSVVNETFAWSSEEGALQGQRMHVILTPSIVDVQERGLKPEDVRFDPLKDRMTYDNPLAQSVREALLRRDIDGELFSDDFYKAEGTVVPGGEDQVNKAMAIGPSGMGSNTKNIDFERWDRVQSQLEKKNSGKEKGRTFPKTKMPKDVDRAALAQAPGGIDLNSRNLNMESSGEKVNITFDPAMIAQFRRGDFSGVKIQILDVVPINLMPILGLKEDN